MNFVELTSISHGTFYLEKKREINSIYHSETEIDILFL